MDLGKRIGFLKYHADAHPYFNWIHATRKNIDVVRMQNNIAHVTIAGVEIVHTVETAQKGGFTASRWADQCGYLFFMQHHVNVFKRGECAIIKTQVSDFRLVRNRGGIQSGESRPLNFLPFQVLAHTIAQIDGYRIHGKSHHYQYQSRGRRVGLKLFFGWETQLNIWMGITVNGAISHSKDRKGNSALMETAAKTR